MKAKRPKQTTRQRIGARGEAAAEAALSRFSIVNKLTPDFGFDFLCHLVQEDEVTPAAFFVQVKTALRRGSLRRRIQLKTSQVLLWCSSPIPTFLLRVSLEPEPAIWWTDVHRMLSENGIRHPKDVAENTKVSLYVHPAMALNGDSCESLPKAVHDAHEIYERAEQSALGLSRIGPKEIPVEDAPEELTTLESLIGEYSTAFSGRSAKQTVRLLKVVNDAWEKLSNRYLHGYPVGGTRMALLSGLREGVAVGLKALLYMESPIIRHLANDLEELRETTTENLRCAALLDALKAFHYTPYAPGLERDHVGEKVLTLMFLLFEEGRIFAIALEIYEKLGTWKKEFTVTLSAGHTTFEFSPHTERAYSRAAELESELSTQAMEILLSCSKRDSQEAIQYVLDSLRFSPNSAISVPAWNRWERRILSESYSNPSFGWTPRECHADILSYHAIFELSPRGWLAEPRRLDEMILEAQRVIRWAMENHSDPLVQLQCSLLFGREDGSVVNQAAHSLQNFLRQRLVPEQREAWHNRVRWQVRTILERKRYSELEEPLERILETIREIDGDKTANTPSDRDRD